MQKYVITVLLIVIMIMVGVREVDSQTGMIKEKNKYVDKNGMSEYNETRLESEPQYFIMRATAYTRSHEEGTYDGITKSGVKVCRGVVAVDPRVIAFGTKLYVEGYGYAIALDSGGDIQGNRIDLYMETKKEAFQFGRKEVRVWVIE